MMKAVYVEKASEGLTQAWVSFKLELLGLEVTGL